jgi:hypothetical protein
VEPVRAKLDKEPNVETSPCAVVVFSISYPFQLSFRSNSVNESDLAPEVTLARGHHVFQWSVLRIGFFGLDSSWKASGMHDRVCCTGSMTFGETRDLSLSGYRSV